jgi:hypothetical protein
MRQDKALVRAWDLLHPATVTDGWTDTCVVFELVKAFNYRIPVRPKAVSSDVKQRVNCFSFSPRILTSFPFQCNFFFLIHNEKGTQI